MQPQRLLAGTSAGSCAGQETCPPGEPRAPGQLAEPHRSPLKDDNQEIQFSLSLTFTAAILLSDITKAAQAIACSARGPHPGTAAPVAGSGQNPSSHAFLPFSG